MVGNSRTVLLLSRDSSYSHFAPRRSHYFVSIASLADKAPADSSRIQHSVTVNHLPCDETERTLEALCLRAISLFTGIYAVPQNLFVESIIAFR